MNTNLTYCKNCNKEIGADEFVFYDKYFGSEPTCSRQCAMELLFDNLSEGYEIERNEQEVGKLYEVELVNDTTSNETQFCLYEYLPEFNSYKIIHEDSLDIDPNNENTVSTFFYCWNEDFGRTDNNGEYLSEFAHVLLTLDPELVLTDNQESKDFKELLINYQRENKGE